LKAESIVCFTSGRGMVPSLSDGDVNAFFLPAVLGFVSAWPIATAHVTTADEIKQAGQPSRAGQLAMPIHGQVAREVATAALAGA